MIENATILRIFALSNPLWVLDPLVIVGADAFLKYFSNLSGEIVGVIVGAVLAGCIGIFTVYFTKILEEKRTRKYASKALLSEIEANQNRLQPLVNAISLLEDENVWLDEDMGFDLPKKISFDRTVYSALSEKIGLLDPKSRENVVQYYVKIKFLEDEDVKLKFIDIRSSSSYRVDSSGLLTYGDKMEYFAHVKESYAIGEGLMKRLKGQI